MLKQGKLDYMEISKENKTLKNKTQGKIQWLVTSINAYGLFDKCKLCECMSVLAQGRSI